MKMNVFSIFLILIGVIIGALGYFFFTNVFIPNMM
ncbi:hypothetical protein BN000_04633 [Neobacillus massiliamazoniensis]|uniref:Uncharacterized protein n=1 Tax=Neobacillus massiliamazoniensis TaxID=1499688 RepID=A0A0U1P304_9BACI|nr:hypothetical protein BN000_04633 [Neobacillus massiliamazoniensis]